MDYHRRRPAREFVSSEDELRRQPTAPRTGGLAMVQAHPTKIARPVLGITDLTDADPSFSFSSKRAIDEEAEA
jgi:hypothetical protein